MTFIWSISRDQLLHICERGYYFRYLAPARINSNNETLREIAFLRKVTNIPTWKGKIFHSHIAKYLHGIQSGYEIKLIDLLENCRQQMKEQWKSSNNIDLRSNYREIVQRYPLILLEHLFQENNASENMLDSAIGDIEKWVERFYDWAKGVNISKAVKSSRVWIEPLNRDETSYEIDGIQVNTKADFANLTPQGQFNIFDWKTTEPFIQPRRWIAHTEFQAIVYQLWPYYKYKIPFDAIHAHFVFVGGNNLEQKSFKIDKNIREYTLSLIRRSVLRMQYFNQIHHDKTQTTLDKTSHLTLDDLDYAYSDKVCIYCPFKQICKKELEYE